MQTKMNYASYRVMRFLMGGHIYIDIYTFLKACHMWINACDAAHFRRNIWDVQTAKNIFSKGNKGLSEISLALYSSQPSNHIVVLIRRAIAACEGRYSV